MNRFKFITIFILSTIFIYGLSIAKSTHYQLSQFIAPETCGGCHEEIYSQWKGSLHNLALEDEIYFEAALEGLKGLTEKGEIDEAEHCQLCHTPVGFITGYPLKTSDDIRKIAPVAREGVQCDYCHSITGAYANYNAKYRYEPGNGEDDPGTKRGPFKDSNADYHKSEFSEFHTSSEMCGTCHDVKHIAFGTWLETTYQEWKKSRYNAEGVQCQDCHMYQRPGHPATGTTKRDKNPGRATSDSKERDHIFTHYFAGGNTAIPNSRKNRTLAKMAEERLKNAVTISIDPKRKNGQIIIRIINNGAGHNVPTGLTNVRQVWLKVIVKNSKGNVIYKTGITDKKGYLAPDSIIFNTVFGDGKGKPVDNVARAREILKDKRLKPQEEHIERISAGGSGEKISVEASLLYMGFPQETADALKNLKGMKIPVITMFRVKSNVE